MNINSILSFFVLTSSTGKAESGLTTEILPEEVKLAEELNGNSHVYPHCQVRQNKRIEC